VNDSPVTWSGRPAFEIVPPEYLFERVGTLELVATESTSSDRTLDSFTLLLHSRIFGLTPIIDLQYFTVYSASTIALAKSTSDIRDLTPATSLIALIAGLSSDSAVRKHG